MRRVGIIGCGRIEETQNYVSLGDDRALLSDGEIAFRVDPFRVNPRLAGTPESLFREYDVLLVRRRDVFLWF